MWAENGAELTNNVYILQEYIAEYVKVLVSTALQTTQSVSFTGWTKPKVFSVDSKEVVANCERHFGNACIIGILPSALVIIVRSTIDFAWNFASVYAVRMMSVKYRKYALGSPHL